MKLSTKGRYGLRAMIDLALYSDEEAVSIQSISARQNISDNYLEQLVRKLKKEGLVVSVRGAQGGYLLKKEPQEYTVGMILRLTEGSLAPVACLDGDENDCERQESCVTLILWKKIYDAVSGVVDHTTLQDLVDWQLEKNGDYVI